MTTMKLTFHGGAGSVTGSNFLLESDTKKILIDCGLFQGVGNSEDKNQESFPYNPATIDALFVTHAHLDHIGRIPQLIKNGFRGVIYSTPPTKDIAELILLDSMRIRKYETDDDAQQPPYTKEDVKRAMNIWKTTPYHTTMSLGDGVTVTFSQSGHVLGSAMVEVQHNTKKIVFTGDLGNSPMPLLPDTEQLSDADYLVMESVYGDREHEERTLRKEKLRQYIQEVIKTKGVLLIPAFSLERTQELLFEIESMVEQKEIQPLPVFVDSPLAIKITDIYKRYQDYFNPAVDEASTIDKELFQFPRLHLTQTSQESKKINRFPNPKIIIAGSGMSHGGRIVHHEKRYLPDPSTMLLIVGYQSPGSLGAQLQSGAKEVNILDQPVTVKARVETLRSYSAHRDVNGLLEFVEPLAGTVKKVFVVMGEPQSAMSLTQRLRDYLDVDAMAPMEKESVELEF